MSAVIFLYYVIYKQQCFGGAVGESFRILWSGILLGLVWFKWGR